MTISEMIAEWRKGCTHAGQTHPYLYPGECEECTEALMTAILKHETDYTVELQGKCKLDSIFCTEEQRQDCRDHLTRWRPGTPN